MNTLAGRDRRWWLALTVLLVLGALTWAPSPSAARPRPKTFFSPAGSRPGLVRRPAPL